MAVGIYTETNPDAVLSQNGAFTKPFAITFDGRLGGFKETKLYIRNDDPTYYYTDLELSFEDQESPPVTTRPEDGFAWKLSYGDSRPTFNDWLNIPVGETLSIVDNLGASGNPDTSTYLPFWLYIQVPSNLDIQVFSNVKFILSGNEVIV